MDNKVAFSLSYEHLTRIAEKISWNASWTAMAINTSENQAKPPAMLGIWYELALNGTPLNNYEQTKTLINADHQRLRKLIWPEADKE